LRSFNTEKIKFKYKLRKGETFPSSWTPSPASRNDFHVRVTPAAAPENHFQVRVMPTPAPENHTPI
jgi:hypothetical protein